MLSLEKKLCKTLVIEIAMFLFPSPGDFPNPGMKARSPALQADSLPVEQPGNPSESVGLFYLLAIFLLQFFFFFSQPPS